ncbi:hypothetical protein [Paractinoplanes maris]|uniref:hypothetical protein n=1 Tax=Paractinoplanes maris TaxID=1734446 RepID=UPI0020205812|nr:hypothetical protein [Actinoplanes maris]
MRHFRSIFYTLVLAPAVWVLAGVGFTHDLTARGRDDFAVESVTGLLLLVLAGAAYAILLFAPISPAGPLFGGLTYLGLSAWALVSPGGYAGAWPDSVAKDGFDISRPGYGLAALLALPLICTALSARRWARYEPPVLPLIGRLGRGQAPSSTTVPPHYTDPDLTVALRIPSTASGSDDTTAVVTPAHHLTAPNPSLSPAVAPSTTIAAAPSSAADSPAGSSASPAADKLTVVSNGGAPADPDATTVLPSEEPTATGTTAPASPANALVTSDEPTARDTDTTASTTPGTTVLPSDEPATLPDELAAETAPVAATAPDKATTSDEGAAASSVEATPSDVVAALAAEEPFKIGEVVDLAPEDEATIALATVRDERQTTVVVSWDEAATVAALFNGQASTKYAPVAWPPAEPEVKHIEPAQPAAPETTTSPVDAQATSAAEASPNGLTAADLKTEPPVDPQAPDQEDLDHGGQLDEATAEPANTTAETPASPTPDMPADHPNATENTDALARTAANAQTDANNPTDATTQADSDATTVADTRTVADTQTDANARTVADTPTDADNQTDAATKKNPHAQTVHAEQAGPERAEAEHIEGEAGHPSSDHVMAERGTLESMDAGLSAAGHAPAEPAEADAQPARAEPAAVEDSASVRAAVEPVGDEDDGAEGDDGQVVDDSVERYVVGRAKPAPHTRAVPPELEETRSLEAPDPDRTRTIKIGELTTKLQVTPAAGEEPAAGVEPVRARASVAAPDTSGPDLSGAEVTRSLTAPDPDRTHTIKVGGYAPGEVTRWVTAPDPEQTQASTMVPADDIESTRPLNAPDPDRTHRITVVSSDDAEVTYSVGGTAAEDIEVTRSLSAPDPDRTQAITVVPAEDGEGTRSLEEADPERTHLIRVPELAAPMRLRPPEPAAELADHPGRAPGYNTAAMSHTGDIGGDETQVIGMDPDRTQVIRPGLVEPPGERTEIIRIPVKAKAKVRGRAVADAEQPDFSQDPSSPIVLGNSGRDSEQRGMTVMSVERPPEDEPHIPAQREPS